jgi:hypothetical protein
MVIDEKKMEERDKRRSAYHEAGHAVVCEHFGILWEASIRHVGKPTWEAKAYRGQVRFLSDTTPFRRSVIAYAGVMAEYIEFDEDENGSDLDDCYDYFDLELGNYSDTDRAFITSHPAQNRSMKTAWGILQKRKELLDRIASKLLKSWYVKHDNLPSGSSRRSS